MTPWTVAWQAPLSMVLSRQEYWGGLPFSSPGDIPNPGIKSMFPASPALAGGFFITEPPGKSSYYCYITNHSSNFKQLFYLAYNLRGKEFRKGLAERHAFEACSTAYNLMPGGAGSSDGPIGSMSRWLPHDAGFHLGVWLWLLTRAPMHGFSSIKISE